MTMNKRHWAVQDRKVEVDPWAPAAADLLNKYIPDIETAERATDLMAGMALRSLFSRNPSLPSAK